MRKYDIPFVPSSDESVETMVRLAEVKKGEKAIDLGAGDGKLVIALAKAGAITIGIEIDEDRAKLANYAIRATRLQSKARVLHDSFWHHDLGSYDLIVLYGVTSVMERLEQKILKESKFGCRIVSNYFELPNLEPDKVMGRVYRYDLSKRSILSR
jgi:cyclopropane fatty-acyl-phospholipid synthase-like methyltransferase